MSYSRTPISKRNFNKQSYQSQNNVGGAYSGGYMSAARAKREPYCHYCKQDLCDEELDFYPCPCRYSICYECYQASMESKERRCPFCQKFYEGHHHYQYQQQQQYKQQMQQQYYQQHHQNYNSASQSKNEYYKKPNQAISVRQVKNISSTQETYSSSNMSSNSNKYGSQNNASHQLQHQNQTQLNPNKLQYKQQAQLQAKKTNSDKNITPQAELQLSKNPTQDTQSTTSSQQPTCHQNKLSQIRILQKHILYAIGLSPSIAKEDILRRYDFFGQYGRIMSILINKEKAYQTENQLLCYSAFITYSQPQEASIGILAVDQYQYDGRMIRASYGRTKYCKFFLKDTQCLNKDCPYQHMMCDQSEILTQDDMQKSQIFQQYQALAFQLSQVCMLNEDQFKSCMKTYRETCLGIVNQNFETVMPTPESIYEKKALFKQYEQYKKQNQNLIKHMTLQASSNAQSQSQKKDKPLKSQVYQIKPAQSRNHGLLSTQSQCFQVKNKTHAQLNTPQHQQISIAQSLEQYNLADTQSDNISLSNQELKKQKRNNSTDELRNKIQQDSKFESIKTFEQQISESLRKLIDTQDVQDKSSQETDSKNSQRKSRYQNSSQDGKDGIERAPIRDIKLSRRSSVGQGYQKKGSMKSLIVESLKFLIDDTDVVPNKREPLIIKKETNPPSEMFNVATPAQSHLGGYNEDEYLWNSTLFSQHDLSHQKNMTPLDDKSCYSHQGFNNTYMNSTGKNINGSSVFNQSYFNQHQQQQRVQPFNDSNFWNRSQNGNNNYFGSQGPNNQNLMQTQSTYYQVGRKTTLANDQISSNNIGTDNKSALQLTRSPSQPNYEKLQLGQMATRNGLNTPYHPSQMSLMYNSQTHSQFQDLYNQQRKSQQNTTPFSVTDQNSNKHSYKLNQQNLDLLDKYYNDTSTYRDLYHAKIFTQDGTASQNNIISSQSLFCYNSQLEDERGVEITDFNKRFSKLSERGLIPRTPVKESGCFFRLTDDEFFQDDSQYDQITKNSEPKNYYKEFLSIKESSIFSGNLFTKRRNSLEQDRDKLQPQSLQFNNTLSGLIGDHQTDNGLGNGRSSNLTNGLNNTGVIAAISNNLIAQGGTLTVSHSASKNSKSRSKNRKATAMTARNY
eukprot:403334090